MLGDKLQSLPKSQSVEALLSSTTSKAWYIHTTDYLSVYLILIYLVIYGFGVKVLFGFLKY